jgi:SOS-response transcriptional repressor LexA
MNRIKNLREELNMTQQELADKLEGAKSTVAMYEKGNRKPSLEVLVKLSEIFDCSIDYLLGKTDVRKPIENINNPKKYYMCPVYGRISAGQPNWAEECIEGRLPIDIELMNIVNPEECFFLRVNGESMNKEIQNGAYALIRKTDSVDDGDIAVVLVNGYDATLKVFNRQGDFILLEPMSTDSSFKTQVYGKDTEIKIIGKYIGKMEMK